MIRGKGSGGQAPPVARLRLPRVATAIPRAGLCKRLDVELRRGRIVWIAAPAGSGKTTLAAGYAAARRRRTLWYALEARDGDPATFFYYLHEAAARLAPRARRQLPLLTSEYAFGLGAFARNFFERLGRLLKAPGLLVLDNYHELPPDSPVHALLAEGLGHLSPGFGALILSRDARPPAAYAALAAAQRLARLDPELLALTPAELRTLARRYRLARLASAAIAALHQRTRGWAAGAVLMLEEAARERAKDPRFDRPVPRAMFDYFATEVLQRVSRPQLKVLLETALLPQVGAESARALTGEDGAARVLAEFAGRGFFVTALAAREPTYRYHPLFRDFLIARLRRETPPVAFAALQSRAAAVTAAAGNFDDAVSLWIDAGAWAALVPALLGAAPALLSQGRWKPLVEWIERLPAAVRDADPAVAYWLGMALVPIDPPRARAALESAYHAFRQARMEELQWRAWCGVIDSFVFEWRDFRPLDDWIAEAERELAGGSGLAAPLAAAIASGMFTALMNRRPQHPQMEYWAQRAWDLAIGGTDPLLRLKTGPHLLLYYTWWVGDLAKAALLLDALRPYAEDPQAPPLVQTTWCAMAGAYYWMNAENAACIATVERGLALAEASGVHVWDMLLCSHGMFATLTAGQVELARHYAQRMARMLDPARAMDSAAYYYLSSYLRCREGERAGALAHAKTAVDLAAAAGAEYQTGIFRNDYGRLLYYAGDAAGAEAVIAQALATSRAMRSSAMEYLCHLARAEIALHRGEHAACRTALALGLRIGREQGFRNHTFWDAALMARLYAVALEHGIEVAYVQAQIRTRALAPPATAMSLDAWPWPVRIHTFGRFGLLRDGEPVTFEGRTQKRALDLLKALISFGGREVSEQKLCDALWPGAEADDARANLKMTLHRLRGLLGHDTVIVRESKLSLDTDSCWVDVWRFERAAGRLTAGGSVALAELEPLGEQLLAWYRGPFLGEEESSFALAARERLRGKWLRAIALLAGRLQHEGRHDQALRWYERGLAVEPLAEPFAQGFMRVCLAAGKAAEGLIVYERLRKLLAAQLQVAPAPETEALARALRAQPA